MTTLETLKQGQRGRVLEVIGEDWTSVRLMEMGLVEGEEVELIGFAPLGDPMEFRVGSYRLSLRSAEARRVKVECLMPGQAADDDSNCKRD